MLAETNFLSPEKIGAMLRSVVRDHTMHIDRSVAAQKSFPNFDATEVERSELQNGWTYRLFDAWISSAAGFPPWPSSWLPHLLSPASAWRWFGNRGGRC